MSDAIKTIVVAVDFSNNSSKALEWGIAIARQHGASVALVHALEYPVAGLEGIDATLQNEARAQLMQWEQRINSAGLKSSSEVHPGKPWTVVANAARKLNADLIVLGTRGRTGYKRVLLGSAADRLIRSSSTPLLVIHPDDAAPSNGFRTIVVATDFSEESSLATSAAVRLACGKNAPTGANAPKLILLHTIELMVEWPTPDVPTVLPRYWENEEGAAKRQLESMAASLRCDRLQVETMTHRGYAPEVIEQVAREQQASLVALGTRGQSGLSRLMIGSVAASVLQHVPCPVLTVRKPGEDEPLQVEATA